MDIQPIRCSIVIARNSILRFSEDDKINLLNMCLFPLHYIRLKEGEIGSLMRSKLGKTGVAPLVRSIKLMREREFLAFQNLHDMIHPVPFLLVAEWQIA